MLHETLLAVDVGTTALKMGIFEREHELEGAQNPVAVYSEAYAIRTYDDGKSSDIDQALWKQAFVNGCRRLREPLTNVAAIVLSGTTPGLSAMDRNGNALFPAILMLDQRSTREAEHIIKIVGLEQLLEVTGNMPVAGGCSLAGMLWLRSRHRDIFEKTYVFGHSNTYMAAWLTGNFAIDPSSASLTALYNTAANDLTWNRDIADAVRFPIERLPALMPPDASVGRVSSRLASELGMTQEPHVVIGGNDAVLAAYSLGVTEPGEIVNVNGTCEITLVCLPSCIATTNYNVRAHVVPDRWLTLHVMNAGGKALEWFRQLFCREMTAETFYDEFLLQAIDAYLERPSGVIYVPYLMGSRYSQEDLKAEFRGLTPETSREELLAAVVRGLCRYQRAHLREIGARISLRDSIHITGGAVNETIIRAKKRWLRDCAYLHQDQSSLRGAAMLGKRFLEHGGA